MPDENILIVELRKKSAQMDDCGFHIMGRLLGWAANDHQAALDKIAALEAAQSQPLT